MSNNLKTIVAGTDPLSSDVDQFRQAFSGIADAGQLSITAPQTAPAAPTVSGTGVGNLNGTYYFKVVLITGWQQSDGSYYVNGFVASAESSHITIANGQASISGIAVGSAGVIGRAIYRTAAAGASGTEKFAGIIWDASSTTYTDNQYDGNLGTGMPNSSSLPAAYGTTIPASVPTVNSTGTFYNMPNLSVLPTVGPAGTICVVSSQWYISNGSSWGPMAANVSNATATATGVVELTTNPTSGNPIVPLVPASVDNVQLTGTAQQTIASFTPSVAGNFLIGIYLRVTVATTTVTVTVTYTDNTGAQTNTLLSGQSLAVGSYNLIPLFINATAAQINVNVTAGTANQVYASASIEGV